MPSINTERNSRCNSSGTELPRPKLRCYFACSHEKTDLHCICEYAVDLMFLLYRCISVIHNIHIYSMYGCNFAMFSSF